MTVLMKRPKGFSMKIYAWTQWLWLNFYTAAISMALQAVCWPFSFFSQDREKWNTELIALGFHYLKKPKTLNRFYLEAVIISRYMSIAELTQNDWLDIVKLHEIMQQVCLSPIARLNYCFCLAKIGKTQQALQILSQIEKELPAEHIYFSLVKAKILKETRPEESDYLFTSVLSKMNQKIRKEYLLENESVGL